MAKLNEHADISVALALQVEGVAINAGVSTTELVEKMLGIELAYQRRTAESQKLSDIIRVRHSEGATDSEIAEGEKVARKTVTRLRTAMELTRNSKTECLRGHPLSGRNLYIPPGNPNHRLCRECGRIRAARQKA